MVAPTEMLERVAAALSAIVSAPGGVLLHCAFAAD
jgi:hypothetical protein